MTNVCFAEAIKLGNGNGDRLGNHGGHAPTMEIVSVFKGWMTRLRMDLLKLALGSSKTALRSNGANFIHI